MLEVEILRTLLGAPWPLTAEAIATEFEEHGDAPGAVEEAIRRLVGDGSGPPGGSARAPVAGGDPYE